MIKQKILLNDQLEVTAVYDSGSNISLINSNLLNIKTTNNIKIGNIRTINGVQKTEGLIPMKIKILNIEDTQEVFIIKNENFQHDFLIGLDCIKKFHLQQNPNLSITQVMPTSLKELATDREIENEILPKKRGNQIEDEIFPRKRGNQEKEVNFNENFDENKFETTMNNLNSEQKSQIYSLLERFSTVFAKDKYDIGTVKDYEAHIELTMDKYCSKRPYRCSIEDKKEIEQQISQLLKKNLIEESYSPFAAPVTLAYKKEDGRKSRLCIDFRDLNKLVIPQSQPFPLIDDLVEKTRNCKYFSTLDINSAFWSIPIRIEDKYKTAFVTQEGQYQWTCLPFGLKTSPAIFQRILSNIIRKHDLANFTTNYIDDILIFSKTFDEHVEHITRLLQAIQKEGFRLKISKCKFAEKFAKYLGHIISYNEITPLKDNLESIKKFLVPTTQKQVRQILGKINFYHKYIPDSAVTFFPLHNLLRKNQKFIWTERCQKAFDKIKALLCSQPILTIFDNNLPIRIYTDASIEGLGAVLKQPQENGEEKPVAYFSKKLNDCQKRKKAIYLECLAIKEAIKYWQHWLMGKKHFIVITDHKPLENLNIKSRPDEELGDLTYYLSQFNFDIKYSPGRYNIEADCLSRNPVLEPDENEDKELRVVNLIKLQEIIDDQDKNIEIQNKKNKLNYRNRIYFNKAKKRQKIILSEDFSKQFIKKVHEYYCHIGINQLQSKVSTFYTAKNLMANIKNLCETCEICIKNKSRRKKTGLMSHLGPATKPFEIVSIDTIGGFGGSRSTKKYLHLLVDHFTRFAIITTSKTQNATDYVNLVNKVITDHKIDKVSADQYPGLNSEEFQGFLRKKNIQLIYTAINSPFSNGLNERLNQTLVNKIRCKINESKGKYAWTTIAQECTARYNDTEHSVTKFAPKYLLEGTNIENLPPELQKKTDIHDLLEDRKKALENTKKSHDYNKNLYDKLRKEQDFNEGEYVYVESGNSLNKKKLDEIRIGPYKINKKISNSIFKLKTGDKRSKNYYHISKLIPCIKSSSLQYDD